MEPVDLRRWFALDVGWFALDVVTNTGSTRTRFGRWLADNPLEPGGSAERVLEDPFDYDREDRLLDWWRSATSDPPNLDYPVEPGYGVYYSGPGTSRRRSDTRI